MSAMDLIQNLTIVALAVTCALLAQQTQKLMAQRPMTTTGQRPWSANQ